MKNIFKSIMISAGVLVISFAAGFASQYKKPHKITSVDELVVPDSPQQQLLDSLGTIKTFDCKAKVQIKTEANDVINVNFNGEGDAEDVSNIALSGHLDLAYNGIALDANLGYFDGKMFFDYNENYFKLETSSLLSFINMLPDLGLNMNMPLDFEEFDISILQDAILGMEDKTVTPSGEYYFVYKYNDDLVLHIKTNENNEFTGIRTDSFFFEGNLFKLDVDLDRIAREESTLISPLETDKAALYQNFEPVFTIFDDVYRLTQKRQATVNIAFDLKKFDAYNNAEDIIGTSIDLSLDKDNGIYGIDGEIFENNRTHKFLFGYADQNIYANYHNLKVSIHQNSIAGLVQYAFKKIGNDTISQVITGASGAMSNIDILSYLDNVGSVIKTIGITETSFTVTLDPTVFNFDKLDFAQFDVVLRFTEQSLESLIIQGLKINGYGGDIVISFVDFKPILLDRDSYTSVDPVLSIVEGIDKLLDDTRFRIEFDATIDKLNSDEDITFNGGLQFDIANNLGYGELDIVDGAGYRHNIKLDVPAQDRFVFKYNDTLCGKFETQTIIDMYELAKDLIENPDEHFFELFGAMLNTSMEMPVIDAITEHDYGSIFATEIVKDLIVTDDYLEATVALDLLGMEDKFITFRINYSNYTLESMSISGIELDGANLSVNFYLYEFDDSLEATRLDPYEEYIDFSQIKVLLELGVNTSKFEYYHLSGEVALSLGSLINKNIPIDMKIRNNKGTVEVAVEFSSIPIILAVNTNGDLFSTSSRKASLYYSNDLLYVNRVDKGMGHINNAGSRIWTLKEVCTPSYFLDNILEIFVIDILGVSEGMMNTIGSLAKNENHTIHYEKILKNFIYNEASSYFYFDIDIADLAGSNSLKSLTLKVHTANNELKKVEIDLSISVLITIKVGLDITLVDREKDLNDGNRLTALENFVTSCNGLSINEKHVSMAKA